MKMTIKVFIISVCLLNLNMLALAESVEQEITATTQANPLSHSSSNTNSNNDKLTAVTDDNMLSSITMLAVGFLASRMFKYKKTKDILIAAAGGGAFIVGEIASTIKYKELAKGMEILKDTSAKKDQTQIESLKKLKKSYEDAKKVTDIKKKLQLAAAAAFGAAAAMALFMKTREVAADKLVAAAALERKAAASALTSAATTSCSTIPTSCGIAPAITSLESSNNLAEAATQKVNATRDSLKPSLSVNTTTTQQMSAQNTTLVNTNLKIKTLQTKAAAAPTLTTQVANYVTTTENFSALSKKANLEKAANSSFSPSPSVVARSNGFDSLLNPERRMAYPNILERIVDILFPSAHASMMSLLMGGAGAGIGILVGMVGKLGVKIDNFMFAPKNRAIIWGMLAGLSFAASKGSDKSMKIIDENLIKINKLINGLNSNTSKSSLAINSTESSNAPEESFAEEGESKEIHNASSTIESTITSKEEVDENIILSEDSSDKTSCLLSPEESSCPSLVTAENSIGGFSVDMPSPIQAVATDALKLGDSLSGTSKISGETMSLAASLGSQQNAIRNLVEKQKRKLNEDLAKNGKPTINFSTEDDFLLKHIHQSIRQELNSKNLTPSGFLASVAPSLSPTHMGGQTKDSISPLLYNSPTTITSNGVPNTFKTRSVSKESLLGAPNTFITSKDSVNENEVEKVSEKAAAVIGTSDITTNSHSNIFDIISSRYLKSGIPRLRDAEVQSGEL